jgi:hypothetical protein
MFVWIIDSGSYIAMLCHDGWWWKVAEEIIVTEKFVGSSTSRLYTLASISFCFHVLEESVQVHVDWNWDGSTSMEKRELAVLEFVSLLSVHTIRVRGLHLGKEEWLFSRGSSGSS